MQLRFSASSSLTSALVVALSAPALAQSNEPPAQASAGAGQEPVQSTTPAAEESTIEVTVTAERQERVPFATSRAVTVISSAGIVKQGPPTLPDAMRMQPGVAVQQTTPGQGSVYIRGMTGREVLHLVDGVRLNNAIFRSGPNQYLALIDPYNVRQLEVVRGSSAVLHGSDALGGVIQVITHLPSYSRPGLADTRGYTLQSIGSNGPSAASRLALEHSEKQWAFRAGFTATHRGNVEPGEGVQSAIPASYINLERQPGDPYRPALSDSQVGTAFDMYAGDAAARVKLTPTAELVLRSQLTHQPYLQRYNRIATRFKRDFPNDVEHESSPTQRFFGSAQLALRPSDLPVAQVDLVVSWQRIGEEVSRRGLSEVCIENGVQTDTSPAACQDLLRLIPSGQRKIERDRSDVFGVTAQATAIGDDGARQLVTGAEVYLDRVSSSADTENVTTQQRSAAAARYPDGSTFNTFAVYGLGTLKPLDEVMLTAGLRGSLFSIDVQPRAVPDAAPDPGFTKAFADAAMSAGLHWEFASGAALVGNAGRGVRAPTIDDFANLGARSEDRFEVPNSNIVPEKTWSLDAGFKLSRSAVWAEAYVFHTIYADKIVLSPTSVNGQGTSPEGIQYYTSVNASSVDITGTEVALRMPLGAVLGVFGNFTAMRGVQKNPADSGLPPETAADRIPPATAVTGVWYQPWRSFKTELFAWTRAAQTRLAPTNVSDTRIPSGGTDGFTTFHARASWTATQNISAHLNLDNITDQLALEHGSGAYLPGFNAIGTFELRGP